MVNYAKHLDDIKNIPIMFGAEQDESSIFSSVEAVTTIQEAHDYIKDRVSYALKNITKEQFEIIFTYYFGDADPRDATDLKSRCIQLCSDMNYNCPSLIFSQFISQVSDEIFFYKNIHSPEKLSRPYGTLHEDDVIFGLGSPFRQFDRFTASDRQFSSIMLEIFGNFTKGIPFIDWPNIKLNKNDLNSLQVIKQLSLKPINVVDRNQKTCIEWSKLFNYNVLSESKAANEFNENLAVSVKLSSFLLIYTILLIAIV